MKKKVFTKDLSIEELLKRLEAGEILYWEPSLNNSIYIKMYKGFPTMFKNDKLEQFNCTVYVTDGDKYFLDEVEEPEADESCVGKLCYFWDEKLDPRCAVLKSVSSGCIYKYSTVDGNIFEHCRPLTADEVKQYIKEK